MLHKKWLQLILCIFMKRERKKFYDLFAMSIFLSLCQHNFNATIFSIFSSSRHPCVVSGQRSVYTEVIKILFFFFFSQVRLLHIFKWNFGRIILVQLCYHVFPWVESFRSRIKISRIYIFFPYTILHLFRRQTTVHWKCTVIHIPCTQMKVVPFENWFGSCLMLR